LVLELAQGGYIAKRENILMAGEIGTGKTHLAIGFAVAACRQGQRVRFYTAAGLTNELMEAQAAHRLGRCESALLRHQVLILDEVGFVPFTKAGADLLFSFLSAVHEQLSVILTTTVPFAEWTGLFGGDARLTAALLDRLAFHAHITATNKRHKVVNQSHVYRSPTSICPAIPSMDGRSAFCSGTATAAPSAA
jgi:DNA replication protein DnaC